MIKCLIVDDDDICRMEVGRMVKEVPFLNLTGTASNAIEGFNYILTEEPDLIFLDVMMPGITGFELLECLSLRKTKVIIMSTERKYAADAYDNEVIGFLSKPISRDSFLKAVAKVRRNHDGNSNIGNNHPSSNQIFIKVKSQLVKINTDDILYIVSKADHSFIHTTSAVYEVHALLKSLSEKLQERNFMRVHNSYVVNLDRISSIEGSSLLVNKTIVPVSQANIKALTIRLNVLHKQDENAPALLN